MKNDNFKNLCKIFYKLPFCENQIYVPICASAQMLVDLKSKSKMKKYIFVYNYCIEIPISILASLVVTQTDTDIPTLTRQ